MSSSHNDAPGKEKEAHNKQPAVIPFVSRRKEQVAEAAASSSSAPSSRETSEEPQLPDSLEGHQDSGVGSSSERSASVGV